MNPGAMAALAADLVLRVAQGPAECPGFVGEMAALIYRVLGQKRGAHVHGRRQGRPGAHQQKHGDG